MFRAYGDGKAGKACRARGFLDYAYAVGVEPNPAPVDGCGRATKAEQSCWAGLSRLFRFLLRLRTAVSRVRLRSLNAVRQTEPSKPWRTPPYARDFSLVLPRVVRVFAMIPSYRWPCLRGHFEKNT
jgi:hypothetical protein